MGTTGPATVSVVSCGGVRSLPVRSGTQRSSVWVSAGSPLSMFELTIFPCIKKTALASGLCCFVSVGLLVTNAHRYGCQFSGAKPICKKILQCFHNNVDYTTFYFWIKDWPDLHASFFVSVILNPSQIEDKLRTHPKPPLPAQNCHFRP